MSEENEVNQLRASYKLVQDSYLGDGGYLTGEYLHRYRREGHSDYSERKEQAYYINLMGPIVDSIVKPVFNQKITRDHISDLYRVFEEDADNKGCTLTKFMEKAITTANYMGQCYVVMDSFKEDDIPPTLKEQINNRKLPFVSLKTPLDVITYETDDFDKLTSITFFHKRLPDGTIKYRKYDSETVLEFKIDGEEIIVISKVAHMMGILPVIPVMYGDVLPTPSAINMAQMSKALYNQVSELRELGRDSAFSLLVIPGADPKVTIEVGSKSTLFVPRDVTNMPTYISPDTSINANSLDEIKFLVETIISQGALAGAVVQSGSISVKSGVALAFEFQGTSEALNSNADISEGLEYKVASLFGTYTEPFIIEVEYDREYTPFNTAEVGTQLTFLKELLSLSISEDVDNEIKAQLLDLLRYNSDMDTDRYLELKSKIMSARTGDVVSEVVPKEGYMGQFDTIEDVGSDDSGSFEALEQ